MIKFIIKGLLRDKSRSLFPIIIITVTVATIIFTLGFLRGSINNMLIDNAVISSGYEKIVTKGYADHMEMLPNDLAMLEIDSLILKLNKLYQDYFWTEKITFSGLLDVPDQNNETKSQSTVIGMGIDLFSNKSRQIELWKLENCLRTGRLPKKSNEVLISTKLANNLNVNIDQIVTFIGTTMENSFTTYNFKIVGTFDLKKGQIDKKMMLLDISGAQNALDMKSAASEILGYSNNLFYDDKRVIQIKNHFNLNHHDSSNIFSPVMISLRDSNQMGSIIDFSNSALAIIGIIFIIIVMVVLWNMGIMNGLRRYGEFGLRLAIGETKMHVYKSMIYEAIIIGFFGTIIGTIIGVYITYYFQENGIDYTQVVENMNNNTLVLPNIFYTKVTPDLFYIGLLPGLFSTVFGTMIAGIAIFRREMSLLIKELET